MHALLYIYGDIKSRHYKYFLEILFTIFDEQPPFFYIYVTTNIVDYTAPLTHCFETQKKCAFNEYSVTNSRLPSVVEVGFTVLVYEIALHCMFSNHNVRFAESHAHSVLFTYMHLLVEAKRAGHKSNGKTNGPYSNIRPTKLANHRRAWRLRDIIKRFSITQLVD